MSTKYLLASSVFKTGDMEVSKVLPSSIYLVAHRIRSTRGKQTLGSGRDTSKVLGIEMGQI